MGGSIVDLSTSSVGLANLFIVDTKLIVERVLYPTLGLPPSPVAVQKQRADLVSRHLSDHSGTGVCHPCHLPELIQVAIRVHYSHARRQLGDTAQQVAIYGVPIKDWTDLYKHDASILRAFAPALEQLRQLLIANDLLVVSPNDLREIESGRSYDAELVHLVGQYGLDSNDAVTLMAAQRCGVTDIVTFDRDLLRAKADFTIYTWL
jgi:predicted nucleic acid-binding protein